MFIRILRRQRDKNVYTTTNTNKGQFKPRSMLYYLFLCYFYRWDLLLHIALVLTC